MIAVKKKRFITTIDILKIVTTMFMAWQHLVILLYSTDNLNAGYTCTSQDLDKS